MYDQLREAETKQLIRSVKFEYHYDSNTTLVFIQFHDHTPQDTIQTLSDYLKEVYWCECVFFPQKYPVEVQTLYVKVTNL